MLIGLVLVSSVVDFAKASSHDSFAPRLLTITALLGESFFQRIIPPLHS